MAPLPVQPRELCAGRRRPGIDCRGGARRLGWADGGLRHRDVQIHVGSAQQTKLLTRAEAGERGAPYRDLAPLG